MRRPIWIGSVLLLALFAVMAAALVNRYQRLAAENAQLRTAYKAIDAERAEMARIDRSLKDEIGRLRQQAVELADTPQSMTRQPPNPALLPGNVDSTAPTREIPPPPGFKQLELSDLPAAVQTALAAKDRTLNVQQIDLLTEDGQLVYQVQGLTPDGRRAGMRVTPDGTVLSSKSEVTMERLPGTVRDAVAKTWGDLTVSNTREIFYDDKTTYELGGRLADGRKISLSLAPEGTLLQSEAEVYPEHLPQPVQRTLSETAGSAGTPTIKEIYRNEQLLYQVVLKNDSGAIQMTIGNDGTLIEFNSRMAKPKLQE